MRLYNSAIMAYQQGESLIQDSGVSRSLLKELVELRQIRLEKESLQQANMHYMTLVSHLELTISELKVQLQAKDSEVAKWKSRTKKLSKKLEHDSSSRHQLDNSKEELSQKVLLLEEENAQLKSHAALKTEMERLRLQLEQSNKMQSHYREKYQETKVRLVTLATEQSEDSDTPEDHHSAQRKQCRTAASLSPRESWTDFHVRRDTVQIKPETLRPSPTKGTVSAVGFLLPEKASPVRSSIISQKSSPMSSFVVKSKSRISTLVSHKSAIGRRAKKSVELKPATLSAYIPSFTRARKSEKPALRKISPTAEASHKLPLPVVTDESEFADYFPEENELD